MRINLLTRRRTALGQQVQEPTLLAMALALTGLAVLLGVCLLGIVFVPAFGYIWWTFAGVGAILAWLVLGIWRKPKPGPTTPTGRQRCFRRIVGVARGLFVGVLTCWLGLIVWLRFGPGGPEAPPKADPALIRVVTWNIHCGQDEGPPWKRFDWPRRKHAL